MDNLTKIVRAEIARQYKSVRQFAFAVNIPLSTINSALHNGIGGSSFDTVVQICRTLGIKAISDDAPSVYFNKARQQCETKKIELGNISDADLLAKNLAENCIPSGIDTMDVSSYDDFLRERRKMMAALIEKYYKGL